jgi:hypothetical protein
VQWHRKGGKPDVLGYLEAAITGRISHDRPIYYSIFVATVGLLQSLYAVPIAQGLLVTGVLSVGLAATVGPIGPLGLLVTVGLLALLTPLSWLVSWLMPDVLGGIMVLAFIILAVYWRWLTLPKRVGLSIMLVFTSVVATGNLLLLSLMTGCFLAGQRLIERRWERSMIGAFIGSLSSSQTMPSMARHSKSSRERVPGSTRK